MCPVCIRTMSSWFHNLKTHSACVGADVYLLEINNSKYCESGSYDFCKLLKFQLMTIIFFYGLALKRSFVISSHLFIRLRNSYSSVTRDQIFPQFILSPKD